MDQAFATLEPVNVLATISFSELYDTLMHGRQRTAMPPQEVDTSGAHHMVVESEQRYHKDVLQFRREMDKIRRGECSESPTEPDTDAESEIRHRGMIWTGCYALRFRHPPSKSDIGWVIGKGPGEKGPHADLFFCTRAFAKRHNLFLRSFHARFSFDVRNRAFFISSITTSSLAGLTVDGAAVGREMHVLNRGSMRIRLDSLEYTFQYTDFAASDDFKLARQEYVMSRLQGPATVVWDMPTPRRNTRMMGQWTLGDPLGKGSAGRVYLGSNARNEVVAVKIMLLDARSRSAVDKELAACRALTALAETQGKEEDVRRIVPLKETIDPRERSGRLGRSRF